MIDLGFDKMLIVGTVALLVIGPKDLPRVARTVGTMLGKARRYVTDVKAEVSRSIELEELQKAKAQFESAARDVEHSVHEQLNQIGGEVSGALSGDDTSWSPSGSAWEPPPPAYKHPDKHWRVKRGAMPRWYKQRQGVRQKVQSGAARVARHRPRPGALK